MTRSNYHHGDLREALLEAADSVIAERGVAGLTLRGVAARVGVSHAAPSHHFGDKAGLLAALGARGFFTLDRCMKRARDRIPRDDPAERLGAIGVAYLQFALDHPALFKVMYQAAPDDESRYPELRETRMVAFDTLLEVIDDCQRAGLIPEGDPMKPALQCWVTVHGMAALAIDGQLVRKGYHDDPVELYAEVGRRLFVGIGAE